MCGFYGEYLTNLLPQQQFREILAMSANRGPDGSQVFVNEVCQLGFNRLSIQDLSQAGAQPKTSPSGRYTIVFNGEIYNHLEVRKQLSFGTFQSHGDAETICHALDELGILETVKRLDGMFAIAVADHKVKTMSLVRDFAGIKPLHFGLLGNKLVFASQYNQVIAHPLFSSASINPSVLKLYLEQHHVPAPFGLHQGTHQVLPGEILTFNQNGIADRNRYWELPTASEYSIDKMENAVQLVNDELSKAVSQQLISDVPLGGFLSGGVDSPLVCSYASTATSKDLELFTIGSDSKVHDESNLATEFATQLRAKHYLWQLNAKEVINHWDEINSCLTEPLADYSIIPTFFVSKLARKHVTVALSGDGGDELFFGYERFWSVLKNLPYQHLPSPLKTLMYKADRLLSTKRVNGVLLDKQSVGHRKMHSRFPKELVNSLFPDLQNTAAPTWDVYNYNNSRDIHEVLGEMRYAEFYGMMQKTLRKVDLASMYHSLEVRVPFLQKSFTETSLRIDPLLSVANNGKKRVLKTLLSNQFPTYTDDNKKMGFSVPLGKWIKEDLQEPFQDSIKSGGMSNLGLDLSALDYVFSQHNSGKKDMKWPLFTLYSLSKYA